MRKFVLLRFVLVLSLLLFLPGCKRKQTPELAYMNCMKKQVKLLEKRVKQRGPSEKTNDLRENMADEICREIISECEEDPKGIRCLELMKKYRTK